MKRLIVLKLTDVEEGNNFDYSSEQLNCILGEGYEHISTQITIGLIATIL